MDNRRRPVASGKGWFSFLSFFLAEGAGQRGWCDLIDKPTTGNYFSGVFFLFNNETQMSKVHSLQLLLSFFISSWLFPCFVSLFIFFFHVCVRSSTGCPRASKDTPLRLLTLTVPSDQSGLANRVCVCVCVVCVGFSVGFFLFSQPR